MKPFLIFLSLVLAGLTAGCSEVTAADGVTNPTYQPAARNTQFALQVSMTAAAAGYQGTARALVLQSTQVAATATQAAVDQRAALQASQAAVTARAVETQAARAATVQAGQDSAATSTAVAVNRANIVSTQAAYVAATGTAVVIETQTAIRLRLEAANADRARLANNALAFLGVLLGAAAGVVVLMLALAMGTAGARRLGVVYYGHHKNPLVLIGGAVYNPLTGIWSGEELPPPMKEKLTVGLLEVLAIQAGHSPHPPAVPAPATSVKRSLRLGPLSTEKETVSSPAVAAPRMAAPEPAPGKLPAPADQKPHYMFIGGQSTDEASRELLDLREFLTRGAERGFSRDGVWLGYDFQSGHTCTKPRYNRLVDILATAGILVQDGQTKKMAVPLPEALAMANLENVAVE